MIFTDLRVWKEAMLLSKSCYVISKKFPREDLYTLTAQLRKSAISVPSNIAEGSGRTTDKDYLKFLSYARGSLAELQTQIYLAHDLDYMNIDDRKGLVDQSVEVEKMLRGLMNAIEARISKS